MKSHDIKQYHYCYKITNLKPTDERIYYYGVHTSIVHPEDDKKYMGSSKYLDEAILNSNINNFKKEILSIWNTREDACEE